MTLIECIGERNFDEMEAIAEKEFETFKKQFAELKKRVTNVKISERVSVMFQMQDKLFSLQNEVP